ncbi:MAG: type II toxin-antitoxin system VapC family toxin [Rhodocyclaceae bacterium]|nr:type II toxin-antitoxin system VapC family toxin [Rhodocyclaceae bacterium]
MRLLLDSHVFLWLNLEPEKCSKRVLHLCQQPETTLLLSMVSVWEMQIKHQLGKLPLDVPLRQLVEANQATYGLQLLTIQSKHIFTLEALPDHHRDPFDRLLIAQAQSESLLLATADRNIQLYPVETIW